MNDPAIEHEVIRRWQGGTPMRRIAEELRISRYRVKRIILDHHDRRVHGMRHPDLPRLPESRGSILDGHLPFVQELLTRWPAITAMRVHEELRGRGFTGGYTIVKDLLRRLRPAPRRQPALRFETGPGVQAQMDYAVYEIDFTEEGRRRVNLFSYVLSYSRRQYVRFVESQDFESTLRGVLAAVRRADPGSPSPAKDAPGNAGRSAATSLARDPSGPARLAPSDRRLRTNMSPGAARR